MELLRALGALAESPGPETDRIGRTLGLDVPLDPADHTELFTFQLPPYASIYLGAEGMLGGEARDRIAGFWRATGGSPPPEPDHLAVLLSAYASLAEGEAGADGTDRAAWGRLRHAFFWEHLASWLPMYLLRVEEVAPAAYRPWGRLLGDALVSEAEALAPPSRLPLHLREATAAEEAEGSALLDALLAPARSGLILTRQDLSRAARATGLGLRAGERRYILKNFFDQSPSETAGWLAGEATRQADLYATVSTPLIGDHWRDRARSTATRLSGHENPTPTLQEATNA